MAPSAIAALSKARKPCHAAGASSPYFFSFFMLLMSYIEPVSWEKSVEDVPFIKGMPRLTASPARVGARVFPEPGPSRHELGLSARHPPSRGRLAVAHLPEGRASHESPRPRRV